MCSCGAPASAFEPRYLGDGHADNLGEPVLCESRSATKATEVLGKPQRDCFSDGIVVHVRLRSPVR